MISNTDVDRVRQGTLADASAVCGFANAGRQILRSSFGVAVTLGLASAMAILGNGCVLGQLVGGMAASAQRSGSHNVPAKYAGLRDTTFAVIVAADRNIQSEHPDMMILTTKEITRRLSSEAGASGVLPADEVLRFQFQNPSWVMSPHRELAERLGVDRLIILEIEEFNLHDPGNSYIWAGVAAGVVSVIDPTQPFGGEQVFREPVMVRFPDHEGMSVDQVPGQAVAQTLVSRLSDRVSWKFYDHEEPNVIKY